MGDLLLEPAETVELRPVTQREAFDFVREHHRHHDVPVGTLWWHGAHDDQGRLVGVAVVGRPSARKIDDGLTAEITRCCVLGEPRAADNACSLLYGAARRVAQDKGYRRGLTYILESETGRSLEAAGWHYLWTTRGGSWSRLNRPRDDDHPLCPKKAHGFGAWPDTKDTKDTSDHG